MPGLIHATLVRRRLLPFGLLLTLSSVAAHAGGTITIPDADDPRSPVDQLYDAVADPAVKKIKLLPLEDPVTGRPASYLLTEFDADGRRRLNGGRLVIGGRKTLSGGLVMGKGKSGRPGIDPETGAVEVRSAGAVIDGSRLPNDRLGAAIVTIAAGKIEMLTIRGGIGDPDADSGGRGGIDVVAAGSGRKEKVAIKACLVEHGAFGIRVLASADGENVEAVIDRNASQFNAGVGFLLAPFGLVEDSPPAGTSGVGVKVRLSKNLALRNRDHGFEFLVSYPGGGNGNVLDIKTRKNLSRDNGAGGFRLQAFAEGTGGRAQWDSRDDDVVGNLFGVDLLGGRSSASFMRHQVRLKKTKFERNFFEDLFAAGWMPGAGINDGGFSSVEVELLKVKTDKSPDDRFNPPFVFLHCDPFGRPDGGCESEVVFIGTPRSFDKETGGHAPVSDAELFGDEPEIAYFAPKFSDPGDD